MVLKVYFTYLGPKSSCKALEDTTILVPLQLKIPFPKYPRRLPHIYAFTPKPPHPYINPLPVPLTPNPCITFLLIITIIIILFSGPNSPEMVEIAGGGVSFPIVFFDGEVETDIGNVVVFPSLDFKRFQAALSKKIGISPHQFSVYLSSPETPKRIPITGKVNFGAISSDKGCFFVVVLKRSRRERRRKNPSHQPLPEDLPYYSSPAPAKPHRPIRKSPPENVMLLKRDIGFANYQNQALSELSPFSDRVMSYQLQKERYLMGLNGLGRERFEPSPGAVCEECLRANELGTQAGFHWCVNDAVTYGFRSAVGPIARPRKGPEDFGSLGFV